MAQELKKRTILTRFWIEDKVYHIADNSLGTILAVQISNDRFVPSYYVVFEREGEWCEEMELSDVKAFTEETKG